MNINSFSCVFSMRLPYFTPLFYALLALPTFVLAMDLESSPTADETVQSLPTIIVHGLVEEKLTEHSKKYIKPNSSMATKMDISLKDTPQTVSVVTQQQIQDQGLTSLAEVLNQVVGINVSNNDSERVSFSARGFNVDNIQIDGITTAYSGTGASVLAIPAYDSAIYDHIEVLKGVTGLTTGLGEPSASINMIHKRPSSEFQASGSVGYGRWNTQRYVGDVSGAILADEKLNGRFIAAYSRSDTGRQHYEKNNLVLSGALTSQLTDTTALTLGMDYQKDDPKGLGNVSPIFYADGTETDFKPKDNIASSDWVRWTRTHKNYYIYLDQALNDQWQAKLAYSYQTLAGSLKNFWPFNGSMNSDGSGLSYSYWASEGYLKQHSFDATVNGKFNLFEREHQVVFGLNGWTRNAEEYGMHYPKGQTIENSHAFDGAQLPDFDTERSGLGDKTTESKQLGVFLNTRWHLTDRWKLFAGGRVSHWESKLKTYHYGDLIKTSNEQKRNAVFVPYIATTFDLTPNTTIYTSYTEIFKPQYNLDIHDQYLDPEEGSSIEFGLKNSLLDERLNLNAAVYRTKKENMAEIDPNYISPNGRDVRYRAANNTTTKGIELQAVGQLTDQLSLSAGYAYNKTENKAGKRLNTSMPNQDAKLFVNYAFDQALSGLKVGAGLNWYDSSTAQIKIGTADQPFEKALTQKAYVLGSLYAAYDISPKINVTMNVNNLFNKTYYTRITPSYKAGYFGDPRSYMLTMNFKY